jgi:glucosamine--fructose-6-phosphate aminotransferase (isomerizing)
MKGQLMEREIADQPAVLSSQTGRYFEELRATFGGFRPEMALLAARGTSDNAALYARYLIEVHLGIPVSLAAPSVVTRFRARVAYPRCLAVGISQSGAAPDVAEVLAQMRRDGHATLAITNTPGSRLTEEAEFALLLGAGDEKAVAATKTYSASLLALYQLVRALGGPLPDPAGKLPDVAWLGKASEAAERALGPVLRSPVLFALGRGYGFATAQETGLKLMECALLPCKSYSTADFQHGPRALAGHGSAAVVYGEAPDGLREQGCIVLEAPACPETELAPVWDIQFGQTLALYAARARGLDPDQPQHLSKVTLTL